MLRIPEKRAHQRELCYLEEHELCYLEEHEVAKILEQPDRSTVESQRDHACLAFLYNTGARRPGKAPWKRDTELMAWLDSV